MNRRYVELSRPAATDTRYVPGDAVGAVTFTAEGDDVTGDVALSLVVAALLFLAPYGWN